MKKILANVAALSLTLFVSVNVALALAAEQSQAETSTTSLEVNETSTELPRATTAGLLLPENNISEIENANIRTVPFYSQINDISLPEWRGVSCGIAATAMLIDYYTDAADPDILLEKGIAAGSFDNNAGWSHAGLIALARESGLDGETIWLGSDKNAALAALEEELKEGPVMASVHYTFDYNNPIPHLVIITDMDRELGEVYYNDPAEAVGGGTVSLDKFSSSWKNRYIKIRPAAV